MIGDILFHIPEMYKSALLSGEITRVGALLKDNATGKIIAHIQESGLVSQTLSNLGSISPFDPIGSVSSLYANAQLKQLKTMVDGLQLLQYVTLGASVVGIGVSVIGFAVINKKLHSIENQITQLRERLDHQFYELFKRDLRTHYSRILSLIERANQAYLMKNSSDEWLSVAGELADESAFVRSEIKYSLEQKVFDADLFTSLVYSMTLCDAGRIECLMLSNELLTAQRVSSDIAHHYGSVFDEILPTNLTAKILDSETELDHRSYIRWTTTQTRMKNLLQGVRDATDAAYTKPHLIETLIQKKVDGRQYLQMLQEEKEQPLLLLPAH